MAMPGATEILILLVLAAGAFYLAHALWRRRRRAERRGFEVAPGVRRDDETPAPPAGT